MQKTKLQEVLGEMKRKEKKRKKKGKKKRELGVTITQSKFTDTADKGELLVHKCS